MEKTTWHFHKISILTVIVAGAFMGFCAWVAHHFALSYWYKRDDIVPFLMILGFFGVSCWVFWRECCYWYNGFRRPSFVHLDKTALRYHTYPTGAGEIEYEKICTLKLIYSTHKGNIYNGKIIVGYFPNNQRSADNIEYAVLDLKYLIYPIKFTLSQKDNLYLSELRDLENALRERCPNVSAQYDRYFE